MQLRYGLMAAAMVVCVSVAPSTRADIVVANNSVGGATATVIDGYAAIDAFTAIDRSTGIDGSTVIDGSQGDPMPGIGASSTDRGEAGIGNPAPGPGLLLFAATAFAYLWFWKPKSRGRQKSREPKSRGSEKSETATFA